jgi:hypothetical protein
MATVRVRIVILTVWITLSVCPFNRMAHTANRCLSQIITHAYHQLTMTRTSTDIILPLLITLVQPGKEKGLANIKQSELLQNKIS